MLEVLFIGDQKIYPLMHSLEDMLKTTVRFKIIEVDKRRRRVVGSIRALASEARKEAREKFWAEAQVNQVYTGT